jgi:PIN domain nuclease of toxin-antitoxin system
LLLDTHTFLWHLDGSPRLSSSAIALLTNPANELLLSVVSVWEIAIKVNIGKLTLSAAFPVYVAVAIKGYRLTVLPLNQSDCDLYSTLPFPLHTHRVPFDRMLNTQALRQNLTVLGVDTNFDAYGVTRLW